MLKQIIVIDEAKNNPLEHRRIFALKKKQDSMDIIISMNTSVKQHVLCRFEGVFIYSKKTIQAYHPSRMSQIVVS